MKRWMIAVVVVMVCVGVKGLFAAPIGNPLKEPLKGDLMVGYEWIYVDDKKVEHSYFSDRQKYRLSLHLAKFTYGLLEGLTVNGEVGLGRLRNVSQSVPHGYQAAWGGGFSWDVLENLHSFFPGIPKELPWGISSGFSGSYVATESDGDNPSPNSLSTANYRYNERWKEFQLAWWIARDFGAFTPYSGLLLSWVHVRQKEDPDTGIVTTRSLQNNSDLGYFFGLDLNLGKCELFKETRFLKDLNLNFEFRGESETAFTAGINWVWKY